MIRTLLASAVLGATLVGLGVDLARTAYSATRTAQMVTLASLGGPDRYAIVADRVAGAR